MPNPMTSMSGKPNSTPEHERDFQKQVLNYLKQRGGYWVKIHVSAYQSQGEPDIVGCYMGCFVAFELKVGKNQTSKLQEHKLQLITRSGGYASAPRSLQEVKEVLDEISRIQCGGEPR